jgi:hypothetical protein
MEPMEKSNRANRFSTEVLARAVRMIFEHEHEYANQSAVKRGAILDHRNAA